MTGLLEKLKSLLGREQEPVVEQAGLAEEFKARYLSFRQLLAANNKALELMSELEAAAGGGRVFGMSFLRSRITALGGERLSDGGPAGTPGPGQVPRPGPPPQAHPVPVGGHSGPRRGGRRRRADLAPGGHRPAPGRGGRGQDGQPGGDDESPGPQGAPRLCDHRRRLAQAVGRGRPGAGDQPPSAGGGPGERRGAVHSEQPTPPAHRGHPPAPRAEPGPGQGLRRAGRRGRGRGAGVATLQRPGRGQRRGLLCRAVLHPTQRAPRVYRADLQGGGRPASTAPRPCTTAWSGACATTSWPWPWAVWPWWEG